MTDSPSDTPASPQSAPHASEPQTQPKPQVKVDPAYRRSLLSAEQKSQEDFDKTVLSLSGGALAVSFIFVKDVVGDQPIRDSVYLLYAWIFWATSSFAVLFSFYLSHLALRKAVKQLDDGSIHRGRPGGIYSVIISIINPFGALLFFLGVVSMGVFVHENLSAKEIAMSDKDRQIPKPEPRPQDRPKKEDKGGTYSPEHGYIPPPPPPPADDNRG
jgi:hypothetical protein